MCQNSGGPQKTHPYTPTKPHQYKKKGVCHAGGLRMFGVVSHPTISHLSDQLVQSHQPSFCRFSQVGKAPSGFVNEPLVIPNRQPQVGAFQLISDRISTGLFRPFRQSQHKVEGLNSRQLIIPNPLVTLTYLNHILACPLRSFRAPHLLVRRGMQGHKSGIISDSMIELLD